VQETIQEKAREIGRLLSQTSEYAALRKANTRLSDDREAVTLINRLSTLEAELTTALRAGREPAVEQQQEYEKTVEELQQQTIYQEVVAAQSNFERLMGKINEEIARGIESGEQSRIILP
jgi:cell fate (sporulation/competence/biofilm development) regulator YlbF (YheA/YmcA/DUF963 family)